MTSNGATTANGRKGGQDDGDDDYEEQTIVVELTGVFDHDAVKHDVAKGEARLVKLDTDQPVLQVGGGLYCCHWEKVVGTDLILETQPRTDETRLVGSSDRRLVAEKAVVLPKNENRSSEQKLK